MDKKLTRSLHRVYHLISQPYAVVVISFFILICIAVGIMRGFDEMWFRVLEAISIFITLFMVFIIEHTQYAEVKAIQEKLDELIKKLPQADNSKVKIEKKYKGEKK